MLRAVFCRTCLLDGFGWSIGEGVRAMRSESPLTPAFEHRRHPGYEVRVRNPKMYLWGSASITVDTTFDKPLLLHIRNNVFGQEIGLHTETTAGSKSLGSLQAGEAYTIAIQGLSGVYATCSGESLVDCLLQESK
jgi:hypothetical protein